MRMPRTVNGVGRSNCFTIIRYSTFNALSTSNLTDICKADSLNVSSFFFQAIPKAHGCVDLETSEKTHGWSDKLALLHGRKTDYFSVDKLHERYPTIGI